MTIQYCRYEVDPNNSESWTCKVKLIPFPDNEGVANKGFDVHDFRVETSDKFKEINQAIHLKARDIMKSIDIVNGEPVMKGNALKKVKDKIGKMSQGAITDTAVRSELKGELIADLGKSGQSESDLVKELKDKGRRDIEGIDDLNTVDLIRAREAVRA